MAVGGVRIAVVGTTGFSESERDEIDVLAKRLPIVLAANFSVAVNVLAWLTREATRRLGPEYDAEIVEIHHAAIASASRSAVPLGASRFAGCRAARA